MTKNWKHTIKEWWKNNDEMAEKLAQEICEKIRREWRKTQNRMQEVLQYNPSFTREFLSDPSSDILPLPYIPLPEIPRDLLEIISDTTRQSLERGILEKVRSLIYILTHGKVMEGLENELFLERSILLKHTSIILGEIPLSPELFEKDNEDDYFLSKTIAWINDEQQLVTFSIQTTEDESWNPVIVSLYVFHHPETIQEAVYELKNFEWILIGRPQAIQYLRSLL